MRQLRRPFAAFILAASGLAAGCLRPASAASDTPVSLPVRAVGGPESAGKAPGSVALQEQEPASQPDVTLERHAPLERLGVWGIVEPATHRDAVERVVGMVGDTSVLDAARRRGLDVVNVAWEDTGRYQGSSLGPNISDVTLQVRFQDERIGAEQAALMPVVRFPNFTDRSADIAAEKLMVRVGNEKDPKKLHSVRITDVLSNLRGFASRPWNIRGSGNLLAKRDTHFLVSAQAVFLPIPRRGRAEFNPVVFNYQSAPMSPAVLTVLVTRQGTSIRVIENRAEESGVSGMGQELYFNAGGARAALTAERKSDVRARIDEKGGPASDDERSALESGADVLLLVQVPLKHSGRGALGGLAEASGAGAPGLSAAAPKAAAKSRSAPRRMQSDVEQAVLGHGKKRGLFDEGGGLLLERDPRFPIRVTVQFYKATSNGVVSEGDLDTIARSIGAVYEHADFVGSLVVPSGDQGRPTEWQTRKTSWLGGPGTGT
ncbi:MAG TPA: hypothetical protein VF989_18795 [Polyangiaceae bacterium]|jgi:hypothetical protein